MDAGLAAGLCALAFIAGCTAAPVAPPAALQQRYLLRAYAADGRQVGPGLYFGENMRGGHLQINDTLSSYCTEVPADLGLDLLNRGANARARRERN